MRPASRSRMPAKASARAKNSAGRRRRRRDRISRGGRGSRLRHADRSTTIRSSCSPRPASGRDDELTVYEPSQFVYGLKNSLAQKLGIAPDKVRVVSPYRRRRLRVQGAARGRAPGSSPLPPGSSSRPVKLVATRDQGFTIQTYRAETRHRVRLGARQGRQDRRLQPRRPGAHLAARPLRRRRRRRQRDGFIGYGALKTDVTLVHADRNTPGFMRSPPEVPYIYALESAMDELAVKLDMDPVELRRRQRHDDGRAPARHIRAAR